MNEEACSESSGEGGSMSYWDRGVVEEGVLSR